MLYPVSVLHSFLLYSIPEISYYMNMPYFVYLFISWWIFHFLAIMNHAAVNIYLQAFVCQWIFISLGCLVGTTLTLTLHVRKPRHEWLSYLPGSHNWCVTEPCLELRQPGSRVCALPRASYTAAPVQGVGEGRRAQQTCPCPRAAYRETTGRNQRHKATSVTAVALENHKVLAGGPWDLSSSEVLGLSSAGCGGADQAEMVGGEAAALLGRACQG